MTKKQLRKHDLGEGPNATPDRNRRVEVFQLFIQDGLQARSNAISEGTLGAHIVQEEAATGGLHKWGWIKNLS